MVLWKWVLILCEKIPVSVRKVMKPPGLGSWKPLVAKVDLVRLLPQNWYSDWVYNSVVSIRSYQQVRSADVKMETQKGGQASGRPGARGCTNAPCLWCQIFQTCSQEASRICNPVPVFPYMKPSITDCVKQWMEFILWLSPNISVSS